MDDCDLHTQEQASLKAVEFAPDALIIVTISGRIVVFNTRAEFVFGYDRSDVIGQDLSMLIPAPMRASHAELFKGFMANPSKRSMGLGRELKALHRSGVEFRVLIELSPFPIAGAGIHTMAVVRVLDGIDAVAGATPGAA